MPKVSVIVPVYNVEKYIGQCIESILNQSWKEWELILVNDASTDGSYAVMNKYALRDGRIKVISYDVNKGPMYARQEGCKVANGEFVTFCDGDDTLPDYSLELLYSIALENNADVVVGQFRQIENNGNEKPFPITADLKYGNDKIAFFKAVLRFEMPQGLCGKMFKKEIIKLEPVVFENVTMGEDAGILFQYIAHIERAIVVKKATYNYLQHSNSSTHNTMKESSLEGICKLMKLREDIVKRYDSLFVDFNKYVIKSLIPLYAQYKKRLKLYLIKYGLNTYVSNSNIFRFFSLGESWKLILQRDLYPFLYRLYKVIR